MQNAKRKTLCEVRRQNAKRNRNAKRKKKKSNAKNAKCKTHKTQNAQNVGCMFKMQGQNAASLGMRPKLQALPSSEPAISLTL